MTNQNKILAVLLLLVITLLGSFWPTFVELHHRWSDLDGSYSYGYVVPLMAAYMLWLRLPAAALASASISTVLTRLGSLAAAVIALSATLAWAMSYLTFTGAIAQLMLPIIFLSLMILLLGIPTSRKLLLPIVFLFFAIPVWEVLIEPLRMVAVFVTEQLLLLWQIPALLNGYSIQLTSGVVVIAGGCSGLNFLMTGLVIGVFYAFSFLSGKGRWIAIVLIVILSLIANWVRIFLLVLIGHYSEMQHPLMQEHGTFGWVIYAVALAIYFVLMNVVEKSLASTEGTISAASNTPSPSFSAENSALFNRRFFIGCLVAALCSFVALFARIEQSDGSNKALGFSMGDRLWQSEQSDWLPAYKGYDEIQSWRYTGSNDLDVRLVTANYYEQTQGKELIHDSNQLAAKGVDSRANVQLSNGIELTHSILRDGAQKRHLYTVFRVGDYYTISPLEAKLYQVAANFQGDERAALLVFTFECALGCEQVNVKTLTRLLERAISEINWVQ
ncbi:EpsI family protein [Pseudomonadales bacterium]|nr:EpsI family protein [Pseudomonadales bacterium]